MLCSSKIQSRLVSTVLFVCILLFESPSKILPSFAYIKEFYIYSFIFYSCDYSDWTYFCFKYHKSYNS